jgi:hypothetical protein
MTNDRKYKLHYKTDAGKAYHWWVPAWMYEGCTLKDRLIRDCASSLAYNLKEAGYLRKDERLTYTRTELVQG